MSDRFGGGTDISKGVDSSTLALHEKLLLIVLDDAKGTSRSSYADIALAGALLLDLVRLGSVSTIDNTVAAGGPPPPPGVLSEAIAVVVAEPRRRDIRWWVDRLPRRMKPFQQRLAGRLIATGVLAEEHHKTLGIIPTTRLPERDHQPEAAVRQRLRAVLCGEERPDEDDAILAASWAPWTWWAWWSQRRAGSRRPGTGPRNWAKPMSSAWPWAKPSRPPRLR